MSVVFFLFKNNLITNFIIHNSFCDTNTFQVGTAGFLG